MSEPSAVLDMEAGEKQPASTVLEGDPAPGRARWIAQPLVAVFAIAACFVYVNTASLDSKEVNLLNNSDLTSSLFRHLWLTVVAAVVVLIIAIPLGIALTRGPLRRYSGVIMAFAGFGQAAPAVGLVVLGALIFGTGVLPFIGALAVYGILPVAANVVAGLDGVDARLVEAGKGMGMSGFGVLTRVELPIAIPVIMTGVRTALVLMCGTAAFGGFVGAGGLGNYLTTGIKLAINSELIIGAVMIAALALLLDWVARVFEIIATPKGL